MCNAAGDIEPPQQTSGKLLRTHFPEFFQAGKMNRLFHQFFPASPVFHIKAAKIINIFIDRQFFEDSHILKDNPNLLFDFIIVRPHFFTENTDTAFIILQQSQKAIDRRRLSGAIGPEQAENFTLLNFQIQMVQSDQFSIPFYQVFYLNHRKLPPLFFLISVYPPAVLFPSVPCHKFYMTNVIIFP